MEVLRQPAGRRARDAVRRGKASAPARTTSARRTACGPVLFWLNILARRRMSVLDLVREHWLTYERNYYTRHDYGAIDLAAARGLMNALRDATKTLPGKSFSSPQDRGGGRFRLSSGRRLGCGRSGHKGDVRRRLAHRLSPFGHRHGRGDAARLYRALRAALGQARSGTRKPRSPCSSRFRTNLPGSRSGRGGRRRRVIT